MTEDEKSSVYYYPDHKQEPPMQINKKYYTYIHCSCSTKGCNSHWEVRLVIVNGKTELPTDCFRCRKCGNDSPWKDNHTYSKYL